MRLHCLQSRRALSLDTIGEFVELWNDKSIASVIMLKVVIMTLY